MFKFMLPYNLMTRVICETFDEKCGKWQVKNPQRKAIRFKFRTPVNYDKEEGYRHVELVIYGPMNYVGVYARECWNVIPIEDLEDDGEGDTYVKKGKSYQEGSTAWEKFCYHDSCWRTDGVDGFFRKYGEHIQGFDGLSFYEVIDVPPELDDKA